MRKKMAAREYAASKDSCSRNACSRNMQGVFWIFRVFWACGVDVKYDSAI
jgi:hypothetical protein